jgi:MYXO-CTERM domain-containing protein
MRRAIVIAALLVAAPGLAQDATPDVGRVLETENFNATTGLSYINLAQCSATPAVNLSWNTQPIGVPFTTGGTYKIFASSAAPATTGTNANFCPEADDPNASPVIYAGPVGGEFQADTGLQTRLVSGLTVVEEATPPSPAGCDASKDGTNIFVCVHWLGSGGEKLGVSSGTFRIQLKSPGTPASVTAGPGDRALNVNWSAPASGDAAVDHYVVTLTPTAPTDPSAPTDPGGPRSSGEVSVLNHRFDDLVNGVQYAVEVCAFSVGGNQSETCGTGSGTPAESDDFWELYEREQGAEQGGCASGPAGALALLGVAGLLALRRRKP